MRNWWLDCDDEEPDWVERLIRRERTGPQQPWRIALVMLGASVRRAVAAPVNVVSEPTAFDDFYDYACAVLGSAPEIHRVRDEVFACSKW